MMVLTSVQGLVPASKSAGLENGYAALQHGPPTPGLVHSELLRKPDGSNFVYRIETLWESRDALDRMRARPEPPEAIRLMMNAGAQPSVEILELVAEVRFGPGAAKPAGEGA